MTQDRSPIVLVDGSSYLYRAFHALPQLATASGRQTGAIRGVIAMLKRMERDYPNSDIVVVFDAKGKTFRDDLYENYKAHRPSMPDALREQIETLHACVEALGFPLIIHAGVEADDVIGTLALNQLQKGEEVIISTGDKDMAQLVRPGITLINTMTNTQLDSIGVKEKFGVPPELIIDYLALIGDKSDNIPGVPKVGEKSAVPLLLGLGDLDGIYARLDEVQHLEFRGAKTMATRLAEHREQAYLSRQLATIKTDVDLALQPEQLRNQIPNTARLKEIFRELEFRSWLDELQRQESEQIVGLETPSEDQVVVEYETILNMDRLQEWIVRLEQATEFAFDTETTSLDYMQAEIVGLSFAITAGQAAYVPLAHSYLDVPEQLDRTQVLKQLKPLLEGGHGRLIGQNIKYDMSVLSKYGIRVQAGFDTMLESYVWNPVAGRHDMDGLARRYLHRETISFEDVAGKGAKQLTFDQIDLQQASQYAAEDADITLQLHQTLWPELHAEAGLRFVYETIEMPLIPILSAMECHGALVDGSLLGQQSYELSHELDRLEKQIFEAAGEPFNLNSPLQLQRILFEKLGLPIIGKTPKGQPSTSEEVLQELSADYPLPQLLLEYRSLSKLKSTYTDKLPRMINPKTGRIHTSYHQAVAATGRLSSTDPNLQNIPIRTEQGRRIRKAFIAPQNKQIVAADYSQIELRIMAHLSADAGLIRAFEQDLDIHKATAAEVFDTPLDEVTNDQRRSAKAINFGLIYGMSAFGLARQLKISRQDAQRYIDTYFARYPGVQAYMERTRSLAHEKGYVETLFGRRLPLPEINDRNGQRRQAAERAAINAPMQGTAADIIKRAMIHVDQWLRDSPIQAKMIMQVHDELVFEVAKSDVNDFILQVKTVMESAAKLEVPLKIEVGFGSNWDEAH